MSLENQQVDCKSLAAITGKNPRWGEIAKDCVCFANGLGGRLLIGIEDGERLPPATQQISEGLLEDLRKRVAELTVNVNAWPRIVQAENGGAYIELVIQRSVGVASTADGRYYVRVGDQCQPVRGDDVMRLASERPAHPWETMTTLEVPLERVDVNKLNALVQALRASDRVKASVKEKTSDELLDHYFLANGKWLTNVGILCIGQQHDRGRLGVAPVIQFLKFDEQGVKVNKLVWDDYTLSPMELVEAIWKEIPDFRESYELPGLFRQQIPAFDEAVIREVLVNALVHRPYTQRGDIYLNLHPDRLEVVNPGRLPLGVTPQTVLHESRRRNDQLARLFHDLKLMEREGSGFDLMYERLLAQGRPAPTILEGVDHVKVIIPRRIIKPESIGLLAHLSQQFPMSQRERITLGLLAQHDGMTARELANALELSRTDDVGAWLGRLIAWQLVGTSGRTQGLRYFVPPDLLREAKVPTKTTLQRIEPHRLEALVLEDLSRYPDSSTSEIQSRIGQEITTIRIKRALDQLIASKQVTVNGKKRWSRYRLT